MAPITDGRSTVLRRCNSSLSFSAPRLVMGMVAMTVLREVSARKQRGLQGYKRKPPSVAGRRCGGPHYAFMVKPIEGISVFGIFQYRGVPFHISGGPPRSEEHTS